MPAPTPSTKMPQKPKTIPQNLRKQHTPLYIGYTESRQTGLSTTTCVLRNQDIKTSIFFFTTKQKDTNRLPPPIQKKNKKQKTRTGEYPTIT